MAGPRRSGAATWLRDRTLGPFSIRPGRTALRPGVLGDPGIPLQLSLWGQPSLGETSVNLGDLLFCHCSEFVSTPSRTSFIPLFRVNQLRISVCH